MGIAIYKVDQRKKSEPKLELALANVKGKFCFHSITLIYAQVYEL
jgi:hypothetical protein